MNQPIIHPPTTPAQPVSPIHRLRVAVLESWALWVALEVGLFEHLVNPTNPAALALKLNFDESAVRPLLQALYTTGYLERTDAGEFSVSPGMSPFVLQNSPSYVAASFGFLRTGRWFEQYPQLLREGGGLELPNEVWDHVVRGSSAYTVPAVDAMFAALPKLGSDALRVLDVGCGRGDYATALAARNSRLDILAIDPTPRVIEIAAARLENVPRVHVRCCAVEEVEGKYDVILLNHIIHVVGRRQSREILQACADRLAPGGLILVQELLDTQVNSGALFGIMMRLLFPEGEVLTPAEFDEHLAEANLAHEPIMVGPGRSGLIVTKAWIKEGSRS